MQFFFRRQKSCIEKVNILRVVPIGVDRAVWTLAAKMDDGAPWHKGVLQGAEKFMASWHKEEEEASRRRATKRDSRDLEPPTHL